MSDIAIADLGNYLEQMGFGPIGLGYLGEQDVAASLTSYPGGAPRFVHNHYEPNESTVRVQLVVRDTDYAAAKTRAMMLWRALSRVVNISLDGTLYLRVTPLQEPEQLDIVDEQRRVLMGCNFTVLKEA
jgi:hypothetical protein